MCSHGGNTNFVFTKYQRGVFFTKYQRGFFLQNMKAYIELSPSSSVVLHHVKSFLYNGIPDEVSQLSVSLYLIPGKAYVMCLNKTRYVFYRAIRIEVVTLSC